jgi:hypothetical protein
MPMSVPAILSQLPPFDCDIGLGFNDTAAGALADFVSRTQVNAYVSPLAIPELRFTTASATSPDSRISNATIGVYPVDFSPLRTKLRGDLRCLA